MVFCGSYKKSNARKLSIELIDVVIHRSVHGDPESKVPSFKDVKALDAFLHSLYNAVGYLSLTFDREGGEKACKAYVNNKISETIIFNSIDELVKKSTDGDLDGLVPCGTLMIFMRSSASSTMKSETYECISER